MSVLTILVYVFLKHLPSGLEYAGQLFRHGHGQRHLAGGGRAFAVHQLWRHRHGDAGAGLRHFDVGGQGQAARPVLSLAGATTCGARGCWVTPTIAS